MKVCGRCGEEIATKDGDNYCQPCDDMEDVRKRRKTSLSRKQRDDVMRSLGEEGEMKRQCRICGRFTEDESYNKYQTCIFCGGNTYDCIIDSLGYLFCLDCRTVGPLYNRKYNPGNCDFCGK